MPQFQISHYTLRYDYGGGDNKLVGWWIGRGGGRAELRWGRPGPWPAQHLVHPSLITFMEKISIFLQPGPSRIFVTASPLGGGGVEWLRVASIKVPPEKSCAGCSVDAPSPALAGWG
jgi:hypothetical protein